MFSTTRSKPLLPLISFCVAALIAADAARAKEEEGAGTNPIGMWMTIAGPPEFAGGTTVEFSVTIGVAEVQPVMALGFYQTVPEGWIFTGVRPITGEAPPITPQPNASGTLEFAWITAPEMPCTVAYTVQIPAESAGGITISGQAEYRLTGPRHISAPAFFETKGNDTIPPVIHLIGGNSISVVQGDTFQDPGVNVTDNVDKNLSGQVQVDGTVDTSTIGTYTLTYSVSDSAGNAAQPVQRQVRVVANANGQTTNRNSNGNSTPRYAGGGGYVPQASADKAQAKSAEKNKEKNEKLAETAKDPAKALKKPEQDKKKDQQKNPQAKAEKNAKANPLLNGPLNKFATPKLKSPDGADKLAAATDTTAALPSGALQRTPRTPKNVTPLKPVTAPTINTPELESTHQAALVKEKASPGFAARLKTALTRMTMSQKLGLLGLFGGGMALGLLAFASWKYTNQGPKRRR